MDTPKHRDTFNHDKIVGQQDYNQAIQETNKELSLLQEKGRVRDEAKRLLAAAEARVKLAAAELELLQLEASV